MILGALVDAGVPLAAIEAQVRLLPLSGYELQHQRVLKQGISAAKVDVLVAGRPSDSGVHAHGHSHAHEHRPLKDILAMLDDSRLSPFVRDLATRIFVRLGRAESKVHGVPLEQVEFHEVGSTDAIIDIVGVAAGLQLLGAHRVVVSPIHVGTGFVQTAHGLYPIPAPATAYLLEGVPSYATHIRGELITPTGAAILAEVADEFGPFPALTVARVGYGAGTRDREIPNVLRLWLGEADRAVPSEVVVELAANIDDMNPELYQYVMQGLLDRGALDVWLVPVHMKKNRPGVVLHALARVDHADLLSTYMLEETTSIGVRRQRWDRVSLAREMLAVQTPWGQLQVKVARQGGRVLNAAPEYEDCCKIAQRHQIPLKRVYAAAMAAVAALGLK